MKRNTRNAAVILAMVLMAVSMLPVAASAAEPPCAKIGNTEYPSFEAALAAANPGDTITLIANVPNRVTIAAGKTITIDLNGYAIDTRENNNIALMTYGNVTVKDSSAAGTGAIMAGKTAGKSGNAVNVCGGTFTLESGSIYSVNNGILIDEEEATVKIKGGKITAEPTTNNSAAFYISSKSETNLIITGGEMVGYNGILLWNNTNITITGGSIEGQGRLGIQGNGSRDDTEISISGNASVTGLDAAIYHPQGGKLTISGNASIKGGTGIVVKGGEVNISGGTIEATGQAAAYEPINSGYKGTGDALYVEHFDNSTNSENYGTPVVAITGGTFVSANGKAVASYANPNNSLEEITEFITGGTFSSDIYELLAPGVTRTKNADGTYTVRIPSVPKTGDNSNVILWFALAFISTIGMMALVRKKKEA
ncbi:MAG: LPXTG cell wall anchor domain-containing protein [Clostridia bacterium]|nr:LPXTG cell wall anchor domain-containing protein [Clostridia bacterium]